MTGNGICRPDNVWYNLLGGCTGVGAKPVTFAKEKKC